jgi:hypothetical protein
MNKLWAVTLVAAATGCGGGGSSGGSLDGGPTAFPTSVPSGKRINQLTSGELATLCADAQAFWTMQLASPTYGLALCRLSADTTALGANLATQGELQARCMTEYQSCTASPPTGGSGSVNCGNFLPTCAITVAEYTNCESASFADTAAYLGSGPSCDQLTFSSMAVDPSLSLSAHPDPACATFEAECIARDGGTDLD